MRSFIRPAIVALSFTAGTVFAAGSGSMPSTPSFETRAPRSPEDQARTHYNDGVRALERADELSSELRADAARQTDRLRRRAQQSYESALRKFTRATELQPTMYQAWNYVGYSQRKLGRYAEALGAYERALALKPGYPEAIEYRAHAYLGLNRLSEAKQAYLELFAGNRTLAARLLVAMQEWVGERHDGAAIDSATLESFASWVSERSAIASQTAALTRAGASAAW